MQAQPGTKLLLSSFSPASSQSAHALGTPRRPVKSLGLTAQKKGVKWVGQPSESAYLMTVQNGSEVRGGTPTLA